MNRALSSQWIAIAVLSGSKWVALPKAPYTVEEAQTLRQLGRLDVREDWKARQFLVREVGR